MAPPAARWNAGSQRWEFHDRDSATASATSDASGPPPQTTAETVARVPSPSPPSSPSPSLSPGANGDEPGAGAGHSGSRRPLTPPPVPRQPLPTRPSVGSRAGLPTPPPFARLVAVIGLVTLLVAAGLWLVSGGDDTSGGSGDTSPTAFPTELPTSPSGYRVADGPDGSVMAVPADWSPRLRGGTQVHEARDFASYVEVGRTTGLMSNLETVRAFSQGVASVWPGYVENSIAPVGEGTEAAAEVDFEYDTSGGSRRRGLYRVFTAPNGTTYEVQAAGPSVDWPRQREVMDTLLSTFYVPRASPSGVRDPVRR
ncbi:hypothetical protein [Streptomyces sp. NPDC055287]